MKNAIRLFALIFFITLVSSCQKEFSVEGFGAIVYDAAAKKFIDSSAITDSTQKIAINNFVIQLKAASLWPKFVAIYPMVGGTAATTKWNLLDPRDLDAAYRLTFYGAPVYSNTGVLFPLISDYGDSHLIDNQLGYMNASISYYSRTQNAISGYDMGCTDGATPYNELSVYSNSADKSEWFGFSQNLFSVNTTGLFMLSSSATNVTRYRNGVVVSSRGLPPGNSYTNLTFLVGNSRITVHPGQKECALATIGYGLTDVEAITFYNIVQNFETSLGR